MMNKTLRNLLFGYRIDTEYWIPIKDIVITYNFQLTSPNHKKFKRKLYNFKKFGALGRIEINKNFELVDGYCSYLICKKYDMGKVPVYFVD